MSSIAADTRPLIRISPAQGRLIEKRLHEPRISGDEVFRRGLKRAGFTQSQRPIDTPASYEPIEIYITPEHEAMLIERLARKEKSISGDEVLRRAFKRAGFKIPKKVCR